MTPLHRQLVTAIELSENIVELAQRKEWVAMRRLDQQRMALMEKAFSDFAADAHDVELKQLIERIVRLNDQALSICADSREALLEEGRLLHKGKAAISAYQKQLSNK